MFGSTRSNQRRSFGARRRGQRVETEWLTALDDKPPTDPFAVTNPFADENSLAEPENVSEPEPTKPAPAKGLFKFFSRVKKPKTVRSVVTTDKEEGADQPLTPPPRAPRNAFAILMGREPTEREVATPPPPRPVPAGKSPSRKRDPKLLKPRCAPQPMPPPERTAPPHESPNPCGRRKFKAGLTAPQAKRRRLTQTSLDCGQAEVASSKCRDCGMVYYPGQDEDDRLHKKYHERVVRGIPFNGWKAERRVDNAESSERIIAIHPSDMQTKSIREKLGETLQVVNTSLGMSDNITTCKVGHKVYLYVTADKYVHGCLVAQSRAYAYRTLTRDDSEPLAGKCAVNTSEQMSCLVGVQKIWVHERSRRQGIASRMLDAMRDTFMYGYQITKDEVAFSHDSTRLLASKVVL